MPAPCATSCSSIRPPPERGDEEISSHLLRVYLVDASGAVRNVYGADLLDAELLRNDAATVLGLGAAAIAAPSSLGAATPR